MPRKFLEVKIQYGLYGYKYNILWTSLKIWNTSVEQWFKKMESEKPASFTRAIIWSNVKFVCSVSRKIFYTIYRKSIYRKVAGCKLFYNVPFSESAKNIANVYV